MSLTLDQALALAKSHQFHGRLPDAESLLRQIAAACPTRPDVLNDLATVLGQQSKLPEAESLLHQLLALSPAYLPAYHNLAVAAERQNQHPRALQYLRRATELAPLDADTRYRLAQSLKRNALFDEALTQIQHALHLNPHDPEFHGTHANLLLLTGQFPPGWTAYESRWKCPSFPDQRRDWSTLRVHDTDLQGKHLALYGEQGYGDMIQFARYLPLLSARGARLTLVVPTDIAPLLQSLPNAPRILSTKSPVEADYTLPLMSLPHAFQTTLDTIPNTIPYLSTPPEKVEKWRTRIRSSLATGNSQLATLNVGIAWAGRPEHKQDRERSLPLALFSPLSQLPGVNLFSLQKGPAAAAANPAPHGMTIHNLTAGLADFADTASFIAALDLVISVDTVIVHLAGALGKPVWTLLPAVPDFRWLLHRDDSPWYPTMRLFRQPTPGDWPTVFTQVESALRQHLSSPLIPSPCTQGEG